MRLSYFPLQYSTTHFLVSTFVPESDLLHFERWGKKKKKFGQTSQRCQGKQVMLMQARRLKGGKQKNPAWLNPESPSVCLGVCLPVCLFLCLSVCLPVCLSAFPFVSQSPIGVSPYKDWNHAGSYGSILLL